MGLSDLIYPGDLWLAAASPVAAGTGGADPTESAVLNGSGFEQQICATPDIGSYFWLGQNEDEDGDFEVGVVLGHGDKAGWGVEFIFEGRAVTVTQQTKSARTGRWSYTCVIKSSSITKDGDAKFWIRAFSTNGYERLLGPFILHLNYNGSISRADVSVKTADGTYSDLPTAIASAPAGARIKVDAGSWDFSTTPGLNRSDTRAMTVQPADGLVLGDVIINRSSFGTVRPRGNLIEFKRIKFDTATCQYVYPTPLNAHYHVWGCRVEDSNGPTGPAVGGYNSIELFGPFFRDTSGPFYYYVIDTTFNTRTSAGATLLLNCSGEISWDATYFDAGTGYSHRGVLGCNFTRTNIMKQRRHTPTTLTIDTVQADTPSAGKTTITFSGAPTIETYTATSEKLEVATSATVAAGTQYAIQTSTDATDTIVLNADASLLASGDTVWAWIEAHSDAIQFTTGNFENIIIKDSSFVGFQNMLTQVGNGNTITGMWVINTILDSQGAGMAQWQHGHAHVGFEHSTVIGDQMMFRNDAVGFSLADCFIRYCILQALAPFSGSIPAGVTIDRNWFISGTARGTNSGLGAVTFDASYRPSAEMTLTIPEGEAAQPGDYHGNALANDGTGLVGAAQLAAAPLTVSPTAGILLPQFGFNFRH